MSEARDDGGSAFPSDPRAYVIGPTGDAEPVPMSHGMTLRDWFAGQALGPCLASEPSDATYQEVAEKCYRAADAMLAARK